MRRRVMMGGKGFDYFEPQYNGDSCKLCGVVFNYDAATNMYVGESMIYPSRLEIVFADGWPLVVGLSYTNILGGEYDKPGQNEVWTSNVAAQQYGLSGVRFDAQVVRNTNTIGHVKVLDFALDESDKGIYLNGDLCGHYLGVLKFLTFNGRYGAQHQGNNIKSIKVFK